MTISVFSQPCIQSNNNKNYPCLYSEKAFHSVVLRLREEMCFVDAGLGTARISMQDEPTGVPINRATSFENKVGAMDLVAGESLIKKKILKRFFMNLVAGESLIKERASARFNDLVGSTDVVAGEPLLLIPRRFRQKRAWMELNKIWRTNIKVKGLFFEKVKRGYSVAIAGFITFLPFRPRRKRKLENPRFTIKSIKPKKKKILVFIHGSSWLKQRQRKEPSLKMAAFLCFPHFAICSYFFYSSKLITCPESFWTSLFWTLSFSFILSIVVSFLLLFLVMRMTDKIKRYLMKILILFAFGCICYTFFVSLNANAFVHDLLERIGIHCTGRSLHSFLLRLECPSTLVFLLVFAVRNMIHGLDAESGKMIMMMAPSGDSSSSWTGFFYPPASTESESTEGEPSVNKPSASTGNAIPSPQEADSPPRVAPFPFQEDEIIGGDSVLSIQRRLLAKNADPSYVELQIAKFEARELFEMKVKIIRQMTVLDPTGDWLGRGARALDNPRTATGEPSLQELLHLRDDLKRGGVQSQAFSSLNSKVFLRRDDPDDQSAT